MTHIDKVLSAQHTPIIIITQNDIDNYYYLYQKSA